MEIVDSTTALLNPEQTIIDPSDEPVHALSKMLQQMCAHMFGQDKCFLMFGGLHIEKLLLEMHDQLIAGMGLLITGAGNVAFNDPNISSALYLIQLCLYAEFKARILLLEIEQAVLDFGKMGE